MRVTGEKAVRDPYRPRPARIENIVVESRARDTRTFELAFLEPVDAEDFKYSPGQFAELSVFGAGEAPISISSSPGSSLLQFCVKRVGLVTQAIHNLGVGNLIGVRGPYGSGFPVGGMEGRDLVFVAGGIGLAPLRALINFVLDPANRHDFGGVNIIYGARTPGDLLFKRDLKAWAAREDVQYHETVGRADEDYPGRVGLVPALLKEISPSPENAVAVTCGPPIMIKFVLPLLAELGFPADGIFTTLEMRMKCGIGKCGRCNLGHKYVCVDGPVFSLAELRDLPEEY